ncbi:PadR family transcriptional regulator [Bacillus sp. 1P06AnD]|uniref:PadR family transcriptional regulator n=1 Tax=Bacillus sp. 1P06AnD TaxID=3132208 RepID=UPI0039A3E820
MDKEILKGSIDILLLSLIARKDSYGYELSKTMNEQSNALYNMGEGTLYPALKRMERKKWLTSYWKETNSGSRRKYYAITEDGRLQLEVKLKDWNLVQTMIRKSSEGLT